ncbi:protein giant-lens [Neocloeon triangulifer]|uniref:protein giant-lens n=1 Tax=Neocloeon triangulifer TaxID=2078957 RepID=UPI00286F74B0|nr:protein giant-lens [Neocloeon triangulifer]
MLPLMLLLVSGAGVAASRLPMLLQPPADDHHTNARVFFQVGSKEEDLPECGPWAVCSKVDLYDSPWVEKQCRCPSSSCSSSLDASDGHTVTDKTRLFKLCEPTKKLPKCRFFRDYTWTLRTSPDNITEQVMHCHCPKSSVAYLVKRQTYQTPQGLGYQYSFACSPQSRLRCQRKEPCRLFTVRKRPEVDEVNLNSLCQCPHGHHCPRHHREAGVIAGKSYTEEAIRTYSGYCVPS